MQNNMANNPYNVFSVIKMQAYEDALNYTNRRNNYPSIPLARYKNKKNQDLYESHFAAYLDELREDS